MLPGAAVIRCDLCLLRHILRLRDDSYFIRQCLKGLPGEIIGS